MCLCVCGGNRVFGVGRFWVEGGMEGWGGMGWDGMGGGSGFEGSTWK